MAYSIKKSKNDLVPTGNFVSSTYQNKRTMNITVSTGIEAITFFSAADFRTWDETVNQYRINQFYMILDNGKNFGGKGHNAGADLHICLEMIGA